ncbi:zinc-ribbon domain-containing protein [Methanobacterium sp.]|uniref:zinc ribbon domain-containing protein n=1 Tax=Methanobacterium sp. TaxID=2164 RepID=UPI003C76A5AE
MGKCENCGHMNEEDATFCESCGANLKTTSSRGVIPGKPPRKEGGMNQSTKILIVVCIILVAGLGITAGALIQMNKSGGTNSNPDSVSQSPTQVTNQASWHEITSYTGTSNDMRSFNSQGSQFKIVMSATPLQNYNTNSMQVDVSNTNNNIITTSSIDWTATEAISQKEKTIVVTASPGTYYLTTTTNSLSSWTVSVYDYY